MKKKTVLICCGLISLLGLTACEIVTDQLHHKAREAYLLQPGALDPEISSTPYYVKHTFKFLKKYQVTHEWHNLGKSCAYPSYHGKSAGMNLRTFDSRGEIVEENGEIVWIGDAAYAQTNGKIWRKDFDRFVASTYITKMPEFGAGGIKTGRMIDRVNQGLDPVCFDAWIGTSHSTTLMLYRRTLSEWDDLLNTWYYGAYKNTRATRKNERVGANMWQVYRAELIPRVINTNAGPFQLWLLPIGDTGYTIALELGASQESLQHPDAHAQFQAMFRHLIESVKIEPLQP